MNLKNPACVIDANHSNSGKQFAQQIRITKEVMHSRKLNPDIHKLVKGVMIESYIEDGNQKIGENIKIRRYEKYVSDQAISTYIHMGGKIGVVVECAAGVSDETIHDVALQIAAAKPLYVKDEEVPADVIEKEKEILLAQIKNDEKLANKPAQVIDKMVEGKVKKYYEENCLLNQAFVKDPSVTVGALLKKENSTVLRFTRYEMGEGLEKKTNDFAAEVEAQMKK